MKSINSLEFEMEVKKQLATCGVDISLSQTLGVAVSGGADSVCLLTVLHKILPSNIVLKVININHNIRVLEETCGDSDFVQAYCKALGVPCSRVDILCGKIHQLAKDRKAGIEEAARIIRYQTFAKFIKEEHISFLCLAHHQDDQLETILMRFLQGSGSESLSGIPLVRESYIRPLLPFSKQQIESYLAQNKIEYRVDKSNFDTAMLRNCIRNKIIPIFDKEFVGWRGAVSSLAKKMNDDDVALQELTEIALKTIDFKVADSVVSIDCKKFFEQSRAVQRRVLYKAIGIIGVSSRVPFSLICKVMNHSSSCLKNDLCWKENSNCVVISSNGKNIFIQKERKLATESGFIATIEENGCYRAGLWTITAEKVGEGITLNAVSSSFKSVIHIESLGFPFLFRSRQIGDSILNSTKGYTPVSKILDDWKCGDSKDLVPIIQDLRSKDQSLVCIWGEAIGFKNWIVKE